MLPPSGRRSARRPGLPGTPGTSHPRGRHSTLRACLTHDWGVLTVTGSDLRIMVYTAAPGTEDADRLALLTVLGTQALTG